MTANYNAGVELSLLNLKNICKNDNIVIENTPIFKEFINDFHLFLNHKLFELMYVEDKNKSIKEMNYKLKFNDKDISLTYLKSKEKKKVIKINKIR